MPGGRGLVHDDARPRRVHHAAPRLPQALAEVEVLIAGEVVLLEAAGALERRPLDEQEVAPHG